MVFAYKKVFLFLVKLEHVGAFLPSIHVLVRTDNKSDWALALKAKSLVPEL